VLLIESIITVFKIKFYSILDKKLMLKNVASRKNTVWSNSQMAINTFGSVLYHETMAFRQKAARECTINSIVEVLSWRFFGKIQIFQE